MIKNWETKKTKHIKIERRLARINISPTLLSLTTNHFLLISKLKFGSNNFVVEVAYN